MYRQKRRKSLSSRPADRPRGESNPAKRGAGMSRLTISTLQAASPYIFSTAGDARRWLARGAAACPAMDSCRAARVGVSACASVAYGPNRVDIVYIIFAGSWDQNGASAGTLTDHENPHRVGR